MIDLSYIIQDNKARNMKDRTEERKNRFNGESIMLTKEEAKKHDQIFIDEITATLEEYERQNRRMQEQIQWRIYHAN